MSGQAAGTGAIAAFEGLTVRYGRTTAVKDVSFTVDKGQVYALLGRNGSGKTSMIRCLLGQWKPTAGLARLFGSETWSSRTEAMRRVGVVPETPEAPPHRTAKEIAAFCAGLYPTWDGKGVAARLERFGVPAGIPFERLSKGQKSQVALALALGPLPELLVLDDPTLGLDVVARKELLEELVGEMADRGTTVFLTTHDLAGVEGIADRVGVLREGRLVVDENMEILKARFRRLRWPGGETSEGASGGALKSLGPLALRSDAWGSEAVCGAFEPAAFESFRSSLSPRDVEALPMSLEEIFIALVGEEGGRP